MRIHTSIAVRAGLAILVLPLVRGPAPASAQLRNIISVSAPAEDETWVAGQALKVEWNAPARPENAAFRLTLVQGNRQVQVISERVTGRRGTLEWVIPTSVPGGQYHVEVATLDNEARGRSAGFRVYPAGTLSFRVMAPDEGDHWVRGESRTVRWRTLGAYTGTVVLRLVGTTPRATAHVIGRSANTGSYTWSVVVPPAGPGTYRLEVAPGDPGVRAELIPSADFEVSLTPHRITAARTIGPRWLANEATIALTYRFEGQRGCDAPVLQVRPEGTMGDREDWWEGDRVAVERGRHEVLLNLRRVGGASLGSALPLRVAILCRRDPTPILDEALPLDPLAWALPPTAPLYVRNYGQFDVDRVTLVRRTSGRREERTVVIRDLSTRRGGGNREYDDQRLVEVPYQHLRGREPEISPYYEIEYEQERTWNEARKPALRCPALAPAVHYLRDHAIARETVFLLDPNSTEPCRLEQVLRGPDGDLYLYWPWGNPAVTEGGGYGPVRLTDMESRGWRAYGRRDFER